MRRFQKKKNIFPSQQEQLQLPIDYLQSEREAYVSGSRIFGTGQQEMLGLVTRDLRHDLCLFSARLKL